MTDMMTETTVFDFADALRSLAQAEQVAEQRKAVAQEMRERMYTEYVQRYDDELKALDALLTAQRDAIKSAARQAYLDDGDKTPHALIEIKRKPQEYTYNDQEVIEALEREGVEGFIRVKKELDKTPLKTALRKGELPWLPVEPAPTDVTVTIKPLGELLIVGGDE